MNQYLLFIDTEASGLPRKWNEPYSKENNWPFSVQISWLIYTKDGVEIKREDHYIGNDDFEISADSIKIHGITRGFLSERGEDRAEVMQKLKHDLLYYKPLVIGHFMELDYHVMAADFYRSNVENPIAILKLPAFCTMFSTTRFVRNPQRKFMKLGELYEHLFDEVLKNPHNAIIDAKATADCFFELFNRGEFTEEQVKRQYLDLSIKSTSAKKNSWLFLSLIFLFLLLIVIGYESTN